MIDRKRSDFLRAVHQLGTELGRPAYPKEIAAAQGVSANTVSNRVLRAVADGQVIAHRPARFVPYQVRLTPAALIELGLPVLAYLAWGGIAIRGVEPDGPRSREALRGANLQTDAGNGVATQMSRDGVVCVSPRLAVLWRSDPISIDAACIALAQRCDATLVYGDRILLGRADVAAALRAGAPVGLLAEPDLASLAHPGDAWRPPFLVPSQAVAQGR